MYNSRPKHMDTGLRLIRCAAQKLIDYLASQKAYITTLLMTKSVVKERSVYNKLVFFVVLQVPAKQITREIFLQTQTGAHTNI